MAHTSSLSTRLWKGLAAGAAAGAAGTTALNAVTYLDMAVRGRPSSGTPEQTVEKLAGKAGADIPGDEQTRSNRLSGLGPLTGMVNGIGVGVALGLGRALGLRVSVPVTGLAAGAAAMAATDAPMAALGVSDPSSWGVNAWVSDAVPHLAYGLVTAAVLQGLDD